MNDKSEMQLYIKRNGRYHPIPESLHVTVKQTAPSGFDIGISGNLQLINDPDAIALAVNRVLLQSSDLYERMIAFEKSQAKETTP